VTPLLEANTPVPLDPTAVYKWNPSMKLTSVMVWTYGYSFWDGQPRDLAKFAVVKALVFLSEDLGLETFSFFY
jgi:hypothetical protein